MKACICTLGCKVNTYESEFILKKLVDNGFEIGDFKDKNDIYIINTCTVTNNSDSKSRKMIREARRKNKDALVIALGCFIEANKKNILEEMPEIDIAIGNKDKSKIIDIINDFFKNKERINDTYDALDSDFENMYIDKFNTRTRAFIKIQDGCENYCAYCIIPRVRGKCRSKDMNTCLEEITSLVNNGFKEIVLTGIHTGNYGRDLGITFATLLREIVKIKGLERIRISSIEATELTDEVIDIIKNNDNIVNHFHVPLQTGNDKILKLMNRKYNIEEFKEVINKLRKAKKDVSITTDVIVGFPHETDEDFDETIKNIKEINFSKLHVFPYSMRNNTPAARMPQVKDSIKKERTDKLLKLSKELEIEYMNKFIGKKLKVLIETTKDGYSYGHTTNYLDVKIKGELEHSKIYDINITDISYPNMLGEL